MNSLFRYLALVMVLLLALPACSLFSARSYLPVLHDFGSSVASKECQSAGSLASTWSTVSIEAPEWLQNDKIRYRLLYADPTQVGFYALDRWLAYPSAMLAQRLSLLNCSHGWLLHIHLIEFEQVFDAPEKSRVILIFRAQARQSTTDKIAGEKLFTVNLPTTTADAKGGIAAFTRLVNEATDSLQSWLAGLPVKL